MLEVTASMGALYNKSNLADFKRDQYSKIVKNIKSICRSMDIIEGLEFIGIKKLDHTEIRRMSSEIDDSEFFRVICYFKFKDPNDEDSVEEEFNFKVSVPKLLDDHYFRINGVDYNGVGVLSNFQPVHNREKKSKTISIKTLINNFIVEIRENSKRKSASYVRVFTKRIHLSLFLLLLNDCDIDSLFDNIFGEGNWSTMEKTLDAVRECKECEEFEYIHFKDIIIKVKPTENWHYVITNSFGKLFYKRIKEDKNYTVRQLGKNYSSNTNSYLEKGEIVLKTINRSLDDITAKLLNVNSMMELFIKEIKKSLQDVEIDSNDVREKKVSFIDIILFPLYKRVSDNIYIYLNSRRKNISNVFKIKESIILDAITTSDVLQYNDYTRAFDAFLLSKVSLSPISAKKEKLGRKLRRIHKSEVGVVDLISTPNGKSAGLSSYLVTSVESGYRLDSNSIVTEIV